MDITVHGYTAEGSIDATIDGLRMSIPDSPGNRHRKILAEWEAEGNTIPAYEPPGVEAARKSATLSRRQFILACRRAGILSTQEATEAAKGDIPQSFSSILSQMTDDEEAEARISWASANQIDRLDPFIIAVAQAVGITDEQLDSIFRID